MTVRSIAFQNQLNKKPQVRILPLLILNCVHRTSISLDLPVASIIQIKPVGDLSVDAVTTAPECADRKWSSKTYTVTVQTFTCLIFVLSIHTCS